MARTHLTRIHVVVPEVGIGDGALLVANQAIFLHDVAIEIHLHFGVFGDHLQCAHHVIDQLFVRLVHRIHINIMTVAFVGQPLQKIIVEVALAKANRGQINVAAHPIAQTSQDLLRVSYALVGHPVGRQHNSVVGLRAEELVGQVVTQAQPALSVGTVGRTQGVDGIQNAVAIRAAGRVQHHPGIVAEGHDGHRVIWPQSIH